MIIKDFDFEKALPIAITKAREMVEKGLYSRFKLSYADRVEKASLGCMGELAFEQIIKSKGLSYRLDNSDFTSRNSDEFDFLINNKKIDTKVAKKSTSKDPNDAWTYGYPQEQNPASKNYVAVGWVDFIKKEVGFYGWITGQEIAALPVVTKNSFAGYPYLTPNHEFKWGSLNKDFEKLFQVISMS
jgi:hypothetical protein